MSQAKQTSHSIDRNDIINYIKKEIKKSPRKEYEVSATDLAKKFGIQSPSMNYHLKRFIEEGIFITADRKGTYGRKIFLLPTKKKKKPIINDLDSFTELVRSKVDIKSLEEKVASEIVSENKNIIIENTEKGRHIYIKISNVPRKITHNFLYPNLKVLKFSSPGKSSNANFLKDNKIEENIKNKLKEKPSNTTIINKTIILNEPDAIEDKSDEIKEAIVAGELTLNNRIEKFLNESKKIPNASQLISKSDKEILSVVAESIQQQQVYLKDLSNQLELMENLTLLHSMIDERNKMMEEMDQIRKEHISLLANFNEKSNQVSVDPQRVRIMHQIIINTLDTYLDSTNQSMALNRKEFRRNIVKEISDLANYLVGVDS